MAAAVSDICRDGGITRTSAGEHLPLVGERCIFRNQKGNESNVTMFARDLNSVPPKCVIVCISEGKPHLVTIKQESFGRIRHLPPPLSAERQRKLLLSLPEDFNTCEGAARACCLILLAPCF